MKFSGQIASESVSRGHPDKVADQISDAVLDACLKLDLHCRVASECLIKDSTVILAGEIGGRFDFREDIDYRQIVAETLNSIGYNSSVFGTETDAIKFAGICSTRFNLDHSLIGGQSKDIYRGIGRDDNNIGAGDQGFMYGYACDDTPTLMPAPIYYCQALMRRYDGIIQSNPGFLRPDAKCQITFRYDEGKPVEISNITVSAQYAPETELDEVRARLVKELIKPVIPLELCSAPLIESLDEFDNFNRTSNESCCLFLNPTGAFVTGGPKGDAGLTGRKIIVDTYGGLAHHGGGAFSGKDPTKVDRSAAYMARFLAKNLVYSEFCSACEVLIGYAIGVPYPIALHANATDDKLNPKIKARLDDIIETHQLSPTPANIIERLNLRQPIYTETARFGHFGDDAFAWEATELDK